MVKGDQKKEEVVGVKLLAYIDKYVVRVTTGLFFSKRTPGVGSERKREKN